MGAKYLIDTNAISDYLGGKFTHKGLDFMDLIIDDIPAISVVNRIELLGQNTNQKEQLHIFVEACLIYDLTEEIILKTIALRKSRKIKIPDAIIAATALIYDLILITHNIRDFESISNLQLLDLHSI
jgi:predicted nucleic acid-binding protein